MAKPCCETCLWWRDENDLQKDLKVHRCGVSFEDKKATDCCGAWLMG